MVYTNTILLAAILVVRSGAGCMYAQEEWTLRKNSEGIEIYTRTRSGSPLKEFRASATIAAPLEVVLGFLNDISLRTEWVYDCREVNIMEQRGTDILYHSSYEMPWPVADRDLVSRASTVWSEDSITVRILTVETDREFPMKKDMVRMPDYRADVVLERLDNARTLYRSEGFADLGGKVPPWLINLFLVDGLFDSVVKTRERTEIKQ
jgi:hypothetical protein